MDTRGGAEWIITKKFKICPPMMGASISEWTLPEEPKVMNSFKAPPVPMEKSRTNSLILGKEVF